MNKPYDIEASLAQIGVAYATDVPVHSTLLESRAGLVVRPDSTQLASLLPLLHEAGVAYQPIGSGSNTLLTGTDSAPLRTVLISQKNLRGVDIDSTTGQVIAEGGEHICTVSRLTAQAGLSGLEYACQIPGTVAGAIATNNSDTIDDYAADFEREGVDFDRLPSGVGSVLCSVEAIGLDSETLEISVDDLAMSGKSSRFLDANDDLLLVRAKFSLEDANLSALAAARRAIRAGRKAMRQLNKTKNPYAVGRTLGYSFLASHPDYGGLSAMELIAATGSLPAEITIDGMNHSMKTPNIIANTGPGTADGYLRIADHIRQEVHREHGIEMPLEVRVIN